MPLTLPAFARLLALTIVLVSLSACSSSRNKDDELAPKKYKPKPPVDPVEQRIFYSGWRHPN